MVYVLAAGHYWDLYPKISPLLNYILSFYEFLLVLASVCVVTRHLDWSVEPTLSCGHKRKTVSLVRRCLCSPAAPGRDVCFRPREGRQAENELRNDFLFFFHVWQLINNQWRMDSGSLTIHISAIHLIFQRNTLHMKCSVYLKPSSQPLSNNLRSSNLRRAPRTLEERELWVLWRRAIDTLEWGTWLPWHACFPCVRP